MHITKMPKSQNTYLSQSLLVIQLFISVRNLELDSFKCLKEKAYNEK